MKSAHEAPITIDQLAALDNALDSLDRLAVRVPLPPIVAQPPADWDAALAFAAEQRFDKKPSCYVIRVRLMARLLKQSARPVLERLALEYPLGWCCDEEGPLDLRAALPPHGPIDYCIPLRGGPVLKLGASADSLRIVNGQLGDQI